MIDNNINYNETDELDSGELNYIIFSVRDDNINIIRNNIDLISKIVNDSDAAIGETISSIGIIFFHMTGDKFLEDKNKKLAKKLNKELKNQIRIVYGKTNGAIGKLGKEHYHVFGPLLTNISVIIKILMSLDYGDIKEILD